MIAPDEPVPTVGLQPLSGQHNNYSIGTDTGVNLLNCEQVTKASGSPATFGVIMAAIVQADHHQWHAHTTQPRSVCQLG